MTGSRSPSKYLKELDGKTKEEIDIGIWESEYPALKSGEVSAMFCRLISNPTRNCKFYFSIKKEGKHFSESWRRPKREWNFFSEPCLILKCQLKNCYLGNSAWLWVLFEYQQEKSPNYKTQYAFCKAVFLFTFFLVPSEQMIISRMFWQKTSTSNRDPLQVTMSRSLKNTNPPPSKGFPPPKKEPFQM